MEKDSASAGECEALDDAPSAATTSDKMIDGDFERQLRTGLQALIDAEAELNALDAAVGDGDTGSTLAAAAREYVRRLDSTEATFPAVASGVQQAFALFADVAADAGGSSGAILTLLARAVQNRIAKGLHVALSEAVDEISEFGGAKRGDRTMLDAFAAIVDALGQGAGAEAVAAAARSGAEATRTMRAGAGRTAYLQFDKYKGKADPGAVAVATFVEAFVSLD